MKKDDLQRLKDGEISLEEFYAIQRREQRRTQIAEFLVDLWNVACAMVGFLFVTIWIWQLINYWLHKG